jgi:hypothetical protein
MMHGLTGAQRCSALEGRAYVFLHCGLHLRVPNRLLPHLPGIVRLSTNESFYI